MIRRLRSFAPPWFVLLGVIAFLTVEGFMQWVEGRLGAGVFNAKVRPGLLILYVVAAVYGAYRAIAFHPFFNADYQDWLGRTPWTVAKPLPLGPVALGVRDGVVLGLLIGLNLLSPQRDSMHVLCLFLASHCVFLAVAVWSTADAGFVYLATFGLGLMLRLWDHPRLCLGVGAAAYLVVHEGVWRGLRAFPWKSGKVLVFTSNEIAIRDRNESPPVPCGWPYDRLLRDPAATPGGPATAVDALAWCLLLGWWISCVASRFTDRKDATGFTVGCCVAVFGVANIARVIRYGMGYDSPQGPFGRIATGRWIIPGFDVIWVAPLLTAAGALAAALALAGWGAPSDVIGPVVAALVAYIALRTPPGLRQWRLTGDHKLRHIPNTELTGVGSSK